jgi:hypothetical protein
MWLPVILPIMQGHKTFFTKYDRKKSLIFVDYHQRQSQREGFCERRRMTIVEMSSAFQMWLIFTLTSLIVVVCNQASNII